MIIIPSVLDLLATFRNRVVANSGMFSFLRSVSKAFPPNNRIKSVYKEMIIAIHTNKNILALHMK